MRNFIEELRKKHFSVSLNLFSYKLAYSDIVTQMYSAQKIQSIKDLTDVMDFCEKHNCILFLSEIKNGIGMYAIIKQSNKENSLFLIVIYKPAMLVTQICVN